jgi:two-component system chemotaxis sensor kinase CheA
MIEDLELQTLFRAESEEHLQTLENGLLLLESEPDNPGILEDLFRSAHSLKGAARMLGVEDLESLAHYFENELGAARHGRQAISPGSADRLYHGLDAMRMLAREACGGDPADVDLPRVLAQLRGEELPQSQNAESKPLERSIPVSEVAENARKIDETTAGTNLSPVPAEPIIRGEPNITETRDQSRRVVTLASSDEEAVSPPLANFKIETIRVDPLKLDALMTLAVEMRVTTARVARSLAAVDGLVELWEEWNREATHTTRRSRPIEKTESLKQMGNLLSRINTTGDKEIERLGLMANDLNESIREIRLLPLSTIFNLFPRLVRDLSRDQGKEVRLEIEGGTITADKHLLEEIKDPLMHMIRNAVDHAVEPAEERERQDKPRQATIWLRAKRTTTQLTIEIADDGRGLDEDAIRRKAIEKGIATEKELADLSPENIRKMIFLPAFSTSPHVTDVSGRGVGLDVVLTNIERLKGSISVGSKPGTGCNFTISAPISLVTTRVLLVQVDRRSYALPIESIQETFLLPRQSVFLIEGQSSVQWNGKPIRLFHLSDALGLIAPQKTGLEPNDRATHDGSGRDLAGILLKVGSEQVGLFVDALLDEQEVILRPFGGLLRRVKNVLGSTMLITGEICMILNPHDLMKSLSNHTSRQAFIEPNAQAEQKKLILVAEDSITTRTQEKRILEAAGYEVVVAVDGADAFAKLNSRSFDAVVSDIEMPNMTGLQLTARIRQNSKYVDLPIILLTSLATDQDRQRGIEVGANAYISKDAFDQKILVETLRNLV